MSDDLLVGIGVDVAAFRRDRAIILAEAQGLQRDIVNALRSTQVLPDLGAEAREAGRQVIGGLREGVQSGAEALRADIASALVPTSLTTGLNKVTSAVRGSLGELSRDFAEEGSASATAYLSELSRGLGGARSILGGFSRQISTTLQGSQGILGDLTPQAERAGRQLIVGLRSSILRDAGSLQSAISDALIPRSIATSFRPLLTAADEASGEVILTLGRGGTEGARALTAGLDRGLGNAATSILQFVALARTTLERANLLSGLARQGEQAGGLLVSGIVTAVQSDRSEIQSAVVSALVPASLPTELRALTSAVATETARLVPILSSTGTEAGRGLITALSASLTAGAGTAITTFARGAAMAVTGTNLLGDLTPVGDKAGVQLSTGVQAALGRESAALRTSITAAIVPTDIGSSLTRLSASLTTALAQFPPLFQSAGTLAGGALITGITAQLTSGKQLLAGFATETSRALTAALTIGDTTSTGDRAGRLLASAIATGIAAEAPRVRAAIAATLAPQALTGQISAITDAVVTEARTLAPTLAQEGTRAGQAYIGAIEGIVSRGATTLKALTTGATVGVVVDVAPIRAATIEQQKLLQATEATTQASRQNAQAIASLNTGPLTEAAEVAQALADAERRAAAAAEDGAGAFIRAWKAQQAALQGVGAAAKGTALVLASSAQEEIGAIGNVSASIRAHINLLRQYGQSVDATSARAVADWEATAALVRENARAIGIEGQELFKLDGFIRRTTDSLRLQAAAARNSARAFAEQQTGPRTNVTGVSGELAGVTRQATAAKAAVAGVTIAGRSLQQITGRLGPALIGVGFGLESLARGGDSASAGLRTALRAVATFATFFGPTGFIVAGAAAATAGILDLFSKTRDQIEATRKKFVDEIKTMVESADFAGLQNQLKKIDIGSFTVDDNLQVKAVKGLRELKAEATSLNKQMEILTQSGRKDLGAVQEFNRIKKAMDELRPTVQQRVKDFNAIRAAIEALPTENTFKQPVIAIKSGDATKDAEKALKDLAEQVNVIREAFARVNGDATFQNAIITKAIPLYDQIRKLSEAQKGNVTETSNELAKLLKTLGDIDSVSIELTRRKLGGVIPDVAPVKVTAIIDRFTVPAASKINIPVDFDPKVLNDSLRRAVEGLDQAKNAKVFAEIFGSRQQVAAATKNVDVLTGNLTRTFRSAIAAELASADADVVKAQKIRVIIAAAAELGIEVAKTSRGASDLTTTLGNIGDAVGSIAQVSREIAGVDTDIIRAIDSTGRLASSLSDLSRIKLSGPDGIFSGFDNFLKSIPVIGNAIASVVNAQRSIIGAISGKTVDDANQAILKDNTEAIHRLIQNLEGFGEDIRLLTESRAITSSSILQARGTTQRGFRDVEGLDAELRKSGSSLAELKRRAEEFGITITDAKGRISALGLKDLNEAIKLTIFELTHLKNTVADQSFIAEARREIFDQTDVTTVAKDWLDQLSKFAPNLFKEFFGGADAATKEGRAIFDQGIKDAFKAALAGKIPDDVLLLFGGIKGFIDFLTAADRSLDDFADTAKQATGELVNVVKGFKDFNLERARFAATASDFQTFRGPIPTPNPIPIPVGASVTGVTTVGQVTFAPTIRIDGRDKDAVQITTEVVTELRRRAKASANPEVRKTVNLLPS